MIKRSAIELKKAGVSTAPGPVRAQLKLQEAALCRILAHARQNPENPFFEEGQKGTVCLPSSSLSLAGGHQDREEPSNTCMCTILCKHM
jgi:hypothetical protein